MVVVLFFTLSALIDDVDVFGLAYPSVVVAAVVAAVVGPVDYNHCFQR